MNAWDKWIGDHIQQAKSFSFTPMQQTLINKLVKQARQTAQSQGDYKLALASASVSDKSSANYDYKVGLISNIHAVRHYDDYLAQFVDVVWGHEQSDVLFNLFDGIIALTQIVPRDEWVKTVFDF